jgi:hypothetical protein
MRLIRTFACPDPSPKYTYTEAVLRKYKGLGPGHADVRISRIALHTQWEGVAGSIAARLPVWPLLA